jgi:hypothetical protein
LLAGDREAPFSALLCKCCLRKLDVLRMSRQLTPG